MDRSGGGLSMSTDVVGRLKLLKREAVSRVSKEELQQVLIIPQRPGRNNVRYYGFDWRRYDYLDDREVGGVRLYFYEREREIARIAAALVRDQYESLSKRFDYRPTTRVPYILYNSHREFENTNVFFVNEYILGVTSPLDLRMALPFWGEFELFRQVSTHEMTHQFQIQKMAERANAAGVESAINKVPLWFTEGLAEYYSHNGIDLETDMFARDIMLNPRPEKGYALQGFWEDTQASYVFTYKLGQLRVAFLADQYGERIIQAVLDQSPRLSSSLKGAFGDGEKDDFEELVGRLAGEKPDAIAQRFSTWMKRRYYPVYLTTQEEPPTIEPVELEGEPDAFSVGADGFTVLYRTVERDSGRSRLFLADRRDKTSAEQVAVDNVPGIESLYPVLRGVTAVGADRIAFMARTGAGDALYVAAYTKTPKKDGHHFNIDVGGHQRIDLSAADLIEAGDPSFSPRGDRVAFFGLDNSGHIDIWTADIKTGHLSRLTNSIYAERDINWVDASPAELGVPIQPGGGNDGTIIFTSDETETRKYNLFAMDPATGARVRLTDEPADHRGPYGLGGGQIAFATDSRGKMDLHVYDGTTKRIRRITDFVTGLGTPAPGPRGLMAIGFYGGQYRVFDVPTERLLSLDERPAIPAVAEPPPPIPQEPIPDDTPPYEPFAAGSWRLENGIAAIGTASFGQGALLFGDTLSDRNLILQVAMYGSPSLTDALALYVDRSKRYVTGFGLFHTFTEHRDLNAPGFSHPGEFGTDVFYLQREFGVSGLWSYPFNTFTRLEARLIGQGVSRGFLFPLDQQGNATFAVNTQDLRTWNAARTAMDLDGLFTLRLGYDTTRYRFPSGAYGGGSTIIEAGVGYLPFRGEAYGYSLLDTQYHLHFFTLATLHFRVAGGVAGGSVFGRQFFLSSYDNLRNYQPTDRRLIGSAYLVLNGNLEFPLDSIIRLALVSNVKGIAGVDFGSVAGRVQDLYDSRTLAWVLGTNLGLGPFEIRIQFAKPIVLPNQFQSTDWVPNISLRYAYF